MTAEELATTLEVYARYRDDNKGSALRAAAMLRQQAEQIGLEGVALQALAKENIALIKENEALKADAERYRILKNSDGPVYAYAKDGPDSHGWFPAFGAELDAAIDAMKGKS